MSHASRLYLDHPYERDNREPGLYWATNYIDTRAVFEYHLPAPPTSSEYVMSPEIRERLCDLYAENECPMLLWPENIVGMKIYRLAPKKAGHCQFY